MKKTSAISPRVLGALFQACAFSLKPLDALVCERRKPKSVGTLQELVFDTLAAALRKVDASAPTKAAALALARTRLEAPLARTHAREPLAEVSHLALLAFEALVALMHKTAEEVLQQVVGSAATQSRLAKGRDLMLAHAPVHAPEQFWVVAYKPVAGTANTMQAHLRALRKLTPTPSFAQTEFFDHSHEMAWFYCRGCTLTRVPLLA